MSRFTALILIFALNISVAKIHGAMYYVTDWQGNNVDVVGKEGAVEQQTIVKQLMNNEGH